MATTFASRALRFRGPSFGFRSGPLLSRGFLRCSSSASFVPISREEVLRNYERVANEVTQAAVECGRDPSEVSLVAVTKTHTLDHVIPVHTIAGCTDFGENRLDEALHKIEQARELGHTELNWHFIGTLQTKKVKKIVDSDSFCLIHSVDSIKLLHKISQTAESLGRLAHVLLQVNSSGEASKQGHSLEEWRGAIEDGALELPGVSISGLMTMAPFTSDEQVIRSCFSRLAKFRKELQEQSYQYPDHAFKELSMGMSNDFRVAIQEGATIVRIGTEIFGARPKP